MALNVEYRVRPVTRYIVTRWHADENGLSGGSSERGEFAVENDAYEVAAALAEVERQSLGYSLDDPRMKFPELPKLSDHGVIGSSPAVSFSDGTARSSNG